MGNNSGKNSTFKRSNSETYPNKSSEGFDSGSNCLEMEGHVKDISKSTEYFNLVKSKIKEINGSEIITNPKIHQVSQGPALVCRWLKYQNEGYNGDVLAQVEIYIRSDQGLKDLVKVLDNIKGSISFTTIKIIGDNFNFEVPSKVIQY